jgi:hypothetical protein
VRPGLAQRIHPALQVVETVRVPPGRIRPGREGRCRSRIRTGWSPCPSFCAAESGRSSFRSLFRVMGHATQLLGRRRAGEPRWLLMPCARKKAVRKLGSAPSAVPRGKCWVWKFSGTTSCRAKMAASFWLTLVAQQRGDGLRVVVSGAARRVRLGRGTGSVAADGNSRHCHGEFRRELIRADLMIGASISAPPVRAPPYSCRRTPVDEASRSVRL